MKMVSFLYEKLPYHYLLSHIGSNNATMIHTFSMLSLQVPQNESEESGNHYHYIRNLIIYSVLIKCELRINEQTKGLTGLTHGLVLPKPFCSKGTKYKTFGSASYNLERPRKPLRPLKQRFKKIIDHGYYLEQYIAHQHIYLLTQAGDCYLLIA